MSYMIVLLSYAGVRVWSGTRTTRLSSMLLDKRFYALLRVLCTYVNEKKKQGVTRFLTKKYFIFRLHFFFVQNLLISLVLSSPETRPKHEILKSAEEVETDAA